MRVKDASTTVGICILPLPSACNKETLVPEPTYSEDARFALALTDNSWKNHDMAAVAKLDFNGAVRENSVVPKQVNFPPVLDRRDADGIWDHVEATTIIL